MTRHRALVCLDPFVYLHHPACSVQIDKGMQVTDPVMNKGAIQLRYKAFLWRNLPTTWNSYKIRKASEVDDYERHRNETIFHRQGNRNPLIDHLEWAKKIKFDRGLGN